MRFPHRTTATTLALLVSIHTAWAADRPTVAETTRQARGILQKYCTVCHNADDAEGGLVLATHAGVMKGGKTGPSVIAGKADASLLLKLLRRQAKPFMPPKDSRGPRPSEIAVLRAWINSGAKPFASDTAPPSLTVPRIPTRGPVRQPVNAVVIASHGRWYAAARTGRIDVLPLPLDPAAKPLATISGLPGQVTDLALSTDNRRLAAAAGEPGIFGEARIFEVSKAGGLKLLRTIRGHRDSLNAAALSADGRLLATAAYDRSILVWDTATGRRRLELKGHNGPVTDVAFDPRGRFLVSASGDRTVKLWSLEKGARLDTLTEPTKGQNTVAVSPDGRYIAAGGIDNRIRIWEVTGDGREGTNTIRFSRFAHQAPLLDLAFSPDGRQLISASEDLSVKAWTTTNYSQIHQIPGQSDWPASVASTPDGKAILVGRLDGTTAVLPATGSGPAAAPAVPLTRLPVPRPRDDKAPLKLAQGSEREPNDKPSQATVMVVPGVASGLLADGPQADADLYRFAAKQGENWVIETRARRDKSPADTRVEVLHEDGRPVLRLLLRAVRDSAITFRPIDSRGNQARLDNWEEMELNQFLFMEGEVVKNFRMPRGPDSGMQFYTISGQRRCFFDTSATAHPRNTAVYIVEPHRPGSKFPDNGLPVFPLYFANDDDGRRELGSDSLLTFTAPTGGHYLVRVTDVRGFGGKKFKYRLTIRQPRPGFKVSIAGKDATIPAGSGQRFTINLNRTDGFSGPVRVEIENLPPGFSATTPLVVEAGHLSAQGVINVTADAKAAPKEAWAKVRVVAKAQILGQEVVQQAGSLGNLKIGKPPKVLVTLIRDPGRPKPAAGEPDLVIAPGESITAMVRITRNGFKGELRFDVDNLPHGVIVDNIGLSGIMVRSGESERQIFLTASNWVSETRRLIHAVAQQEGRQASRPIRIAVRARQQAVKPASPKNK